MKKFFEKLNAATTKLYVKGQVAVANIDGSETTEKIGMVVAAVVLVAVLTGVMRKAMPKLYENIIGVAEENLKSIFGQATYGTGAGATG